MLVERENEIAEKLRMIFGGKLIEIKTPRKRRIFARVEAGSFKETLPRLIDDVKLTHLVTITGADVGQEIELLYHFTHGGSTVVTVGFKIPKDGPVVKTITDLVPGAVLYEREIHEMLGVDFEGHPNMMPLVLPEEWPAGVYPLRKDRKFEELRKIGDKK
jgi:membrane-bound hydrogenase subunit beta